MAEMPTYPRFKPGDQVRIDDSGYPGIWVVEKVNPKKTIVRPVAGGRRLNAPHQMLRRPDEVPVVTTEAIPEFYSGGELVRWTNPKDGIEGLYVVLRQGGQHGQVSIVPLGGGGGRYWRVPHRQLHKVDPKEVLK